jgi:hypothetical protein
MRIFMQSGDKVLDQSLQALKGEKLRRQLYKRSFGYGEEFEEGFGNRWSGWLTRGQ